MTYSRASLPLELSDEVINMEKEPIECETCGLWVIGDEDTVCPNCGEKVGFVNVGKAEAQAIMGYPGD